MPRTRCPNGTRKNKKTGVCESKTKTVKNNTQKTKESTKTNREAKIVDIANLVDKKYNGYVSDEMLKKGWENKINRFIQLKKK